jgi:hypothetical protein
MNGDSHETKRQRHEPDKWIQDESQQRERPAQDEKNDPQEKSSHRDLVCGGLNTPSANADLGAPALYFILRESARESSHDGILFQPEELGDGSGYLGIEPHVGIVNFGVEDASQRMNHGQRATFRQRQPNRERYDGIGGHLRVHAAQQVLNPFAR